MHCGTSRCTFELYSSMWRCSAVEVSREIRTALYYSRRVDRSVVSCVLSQCNGNVLSLLSLSLSNTARLAPHKPSLKKDTPYRSSLLCHQVPEAYRVHHQCSVNIGTSLCVTRTLDAISCAVVYYKIFSMHLHCCCEQQLQ